MAEVSETDVIIAPGGMGGESPLVLERSTVSGGCEWFAVLSNDCYALRGPSGRTNLERLEDWMEWTVLSVLNLGHNILLWMSSHSSHRGAVHAAMS